MKIRVGYSCNRSGLYLYLPILKNLSKDYLLAALVMNLLTQIIRVSEPTQGIPCSFLLSPGDP
jgi:hypothetical protein